MIPKRYESVKYEDVPENVRLIFDQIKKTRKGLYLYGGVGVGKTHIAYALKKQWDDTSNRYAIFWNTSELMQDVYDDFSKNGGDKSNAINRILESESLLILDDMGSEKINDTVLGKFYLLVNSKYNDKLPVIITSNYSVADLAERVGDRIASRIVEMCDIIELKGDDKRLTN